MNTYENYKIGLQTITDIVGRDLNKCGLGLLLDMYGQLAVLINNTMIKFSNEIAYPAQALQTKIQDEISRRMKESKYAA